MKSLYNETLKSLRQHLLAAYSGSTGIELDVSKIQKYVGDSVIRAILDDMKRVLKDHKDAIEYDFLSEDEEVLDYRTLYKVLVPDKADSDISPKNRRKINDYIYYAKRQTLKDADNKTFNIQGAYLIDNNFIHAKKNLRGLEELNFYTSKSNPDIQWSGVFNSYDIRRPVTDELKLAIFQAFNKKNSKICAILTGPSGSGKTTVFRRLSYECTLNSQIKVLWIYNVNEFNFQFSEIVKSNENYLLVLDDWSKVEKSPDAKFRFLNNVREFSNIRLIIGDYILRDDLAEMLYGNNVFSLSSVKNKAVVEEIIDKVPAWKNRKAEILSINENLFDVPLFMVLFVIATTFSQNGILDIKDFESEFKKIVKNDLREIYVRQKGVALAFYYWSCIYKEFGLNITWEALLKLAETYNENVKVRQRFGFSDSAANQLIEILGNYISLTPLIIPGYSNEHLLEYHHDLLVDALTMPLQDEQIFDNAKKADLLNRLIRIKQYDIAHDLYEKLNDWGFFENKKAYKNIIKQKLSTGESFGWILKLSPEIQKLYNKFHQYDECDIQDAFFDFILFLSLPPESKREHRFIREIVVKLIKMGCDSEFVKTLYELRDNENEGGLGDYIWQKYFEYRQYIDTFD
jgi:hypothetical protein